jgi:hypothetical protein
MACHDTQSTGGHRASQQAQVLSVQDESHQRNGWNTRHKTEIEGN